MPSFLRDGRLRDVLGVPDMEWASLISGVERSQAVRLWSAEAWCRMALEGEPAAAVDHELWRDGP